jgi:hypothetical protein
LSISCGPTVVVKPDPIIPPSSLITPVKWPTVSVPLNESVSNKALINYTLELISQLKIQEKNKEDYEIYIDKMKQLKEDVDNDPRFKIK